MKEEILDIAKKLYHNHLTPETATNLLLDLFAVSGQSKQLVCSEKKTEQLCKHAVSSSVCPCNELPDGEIAISSKALQKPYGDLGQLKDIKGKE